MDEVRQNAMKIIDEAGENRLDWFEKLYSNAAGNQYWIPWSDGAPHRFLVEWNLQIKSRGSALVVGCGLGEDAAYLCREGWEVTAFDISKSAVEWAKKNHPNEDIKWMVADLLNLPNDWKNSFDLVVEVHILQAIPEPIRIIAAPKLAPLVKKKGHLVCIGRLSEKEEYIDGPPWPLSRSFIDSIGNSLQPVDFVEGNLSSDEPTTIRFRSVWRK